jgi:hypothetical protein
VAPAAGHGSSPAFQFFDYSSCLWRGKPFETAMHLTFFAVMVLTDRAVPWIFSSESLKIHPSQAVFFIAKPDRDSSMAGMIPRLMLIAVSSVLALALSSCCCLF